VFFYSVWCALMLIASVSFGGAQVFVSFSMPEQLMRETLEDGARLRIPAILNGLHGDSMKKTAQKIIQLSEHVPDLTLQIDPTAFERYNIQQVPALVVSAPGKPDEFDVIYGNLPLQEGLRRLEHVTSDQATCAYGVCDTTKPEVSDDMSEGLGRILAVVGSAEDAATRQTHAYEPSIFGGVVQACKEYPLGARDCCTDGGFLEGLIHCPLDMQALQRAKHEHRVVSLGWYKRHKGGSRHYVYCIFPNKLAGIVQIQGRGAQLGISFGHAKAPNCRGLTPEELARIDFKRLDLSALPVQGFEHA
jgi:type-F conjugative transfer system pilin assembly protein TrbC